MMKPAPRYLKIAGLVSMLTLPAIFLLFFSQAKHNFVVLPIYGEKIPVQKKQGEKMVNDTIYHTIPAWSFLDQDSNLVSDQDYNNQIYIVDFFFTSCPSICPKMTRQMLRLQWKLKDPAFDDVKLLSFTVDPSHDTPSRLKKYAEKNGADFSKWKFFTGDKRAIYELGVNGFLVSTQEDALAPGGFLHSEKFVLVDRKGQIRGFYDGTSTDDVNRCADEIKVLLKLEKIDAARKQD
ncbi:MAG TPA: SCO family protein [Luteibaculaceae bacterium]|nr:SCO family protein [Luteibaculaceae bacterium]